MAAASRSGVVHCCRRRASLAGTFARNTWLTCAALLWLHGPHASVTVSQCQFAHAVGAAAVARMHVFYLQRDVGRVAIGAGAPKHAARPTDGILTSDPGADNRRHGSPLRTVLPTAVALRRRPPHATAPSQALFQWQPTWPNDDYQSALPVCRRWPTSSSFRRSNRHTKPDGCAVRGLLPPP